MPELLDVGLAVDDPAVGLGAKRLIGCCNLASGLAIRRAVDVMPAQAADKPQNVYSEETVLWSPRAGRTHGREWREALGGGGESDADR